MKRQRLISQGALSRIFQSAAEAWKRQEYKESIDILERGSRLDPANSTLLLDLGRAYGMRYDYAAAERCLEKAIRVAPRKLEALIGAGQRARDFERPKLAQKYFEQATQQRDVPVDALLALAETHERYHRREQAREFVERALKANGDCALAHLFLARLDRLAGELESAEKRLRDLLAKKETDTRTRVQAWYERGGILDRMARYDDAWTAFLEAKALLRPAAADASATLQGIQERVREMEKTITADVLQRWCEFGKSLQPQRRLAILCGHPRSGTTLLEQMLDAHPEIISSEETHILHDEAYLPLTRGFSTETGILEVLEAAPPSALQQSRENYFRFTELFLGKPLEGRLLVDKNPALNVLIPVVVRIFPEAKFLIALRDPRDVCLSCFMQSLTINPVSSAYLTVEGTVTQYASVMGFWQTLLPRIENPFLHVRYEALVDNLEAEGRRALDFLDIGWDERVLRFDEHARGKLVRSPTYADVTRPVFKTAVGRWRNYEKFIAPWLERLVPFIDGFGYQR
jgi:Tfp pilus assembly protein PilF